MPNSRWSIASTPPSHPRRLDSFERGKGPSRTIHGIAEEECMLRRVTASNGEASHVTPSAPRISIDYLTAKRADVTVRYPSYHAAVGARAGTHLPCGPPRAVSHARSHPGAVSVGSEFERGRVFELDSSRAEVVTTTVNQILAAGSNSQQCGCRRRRSANRQPISAARSGEQAGDTHSGTGAEATRTRSPAWPCTAIPEAPSTSTPSPPSMGWESIPPRPASA
jgi:hypothetical protein